MTMNKPALTQKLLKEILYYHPGNGVFVWIKPCTGVTVGNRAGAVHETTGGKRYIRIKINGQSYRAHRLAFLYMIGEWPENDVDHEDGNGLHNWWDNLREADDAENCKNQRLPSNNTSGVIGVGFHIASGKWRSKVVVDKVTIALGYFFDWFDAVCARKSAENKYGFHPNHGQDRPL